MAQAIVLILMVLTPGCSTLSAPNLRVVIFNDEQLTGTFQVTIDGHPRLSGVIARIQLEPAIIVSSSTHVLPGERFAEVVIFVGSDRQEVRTQYRFRATSTDSTLVVWLKREGADVQFFPRPIGFL